MINIWGENYFIDLDRIEEYLDITEIMSETSGSTEMKVNVIKLEMIKMLLETILSEQENPESNLGLKSQNSQNNLSIPFKLAFNSLLNKKIINHY